MMVNPASFRLADWSIGAPKGEHLDILPYKESYTEEEYDFLVNESHYVNQHLTLKPGSVIDGVVMYCSVFDTKKFLGVSMLNEKFYPGSGEDYDYNCRANMAGYRCVGTTMSWVWHWWSKSMASMQEQEEIKSLIIPELRWNNNDELWGKGFDIWGIKCQTCDKHMTLKNKQTMHCKDHPDQTFSIPPITLVPL